MAGTLAGDGADALAGLPGAGAPTRGRGDAELSWGEEAPGASARFAPHPLDPARVLDPGATGLLGVGSTAPEARPVPTPSTLAPVAGAAGENAWRRRLAPRHREVVRGFFGPEDASRPAPAPPAPPSPPSKDGR